MQKAGRKGSHYVALRLISGLLRLVGWVSIIIGLVVFIAALSAAGQIASQFENLGYNQIGQMVTSILLVFSFSFFIWGLFTLAFGEILKVLVDIALNTATLPNIADNTNYFYQRLNPPQ